MRGLANDSLRANLWFWFAGRVFGAWVQMIAVVTSIVSIFIIIGSSENPGKAGQSIMYYILVADFI
jgi:hypothetical protein